MVKDREAMNYRVSAVIEADEHGYFAYCPELPGCFSQGQTYEEAFSNIQEAIALYIETLDPEQREAISSKHISTTSVEVSVA